MFLTAQEERKLWADGTIESRNKIIMGFYPYLLRMANKVAALTEKDSDDLAQHGIQIICQRWASFNGDKSRATTYFMKRMFVQLFDYAMSHENVIRIPEHVEPKHYKYVEAARHTTNVFDIPYIQIDLHLDDLLTALGEEDRIIIEGKLEGRTNGELANKLGCTRTTIINRSRKIIKSHFGLF